MPPAERPALGWQRRFLWAGAQPGPSPRPLSPRHMADSGEQAGQLPGHHACNLFPVGHTPASPAPWAAQVSHLRPLPGLLPGRAAVLASCGPAAAKRSRADALLHCPRLRWKVKRNRWERLECRVRLTLYAQDVTITPALSAKCH